MPYFMIYSIMRDMDNYHFFLRGKDYVSGISKRSRDVHKFTTSKARLINYRFREYHQIGSFKHRRRLNKRHFH